jgi:hypothetical protein
VAQFHRARARRVAAGRVILVAVVLAASAVGIAADRPWIEVKSPNFTVVSNAGENEARRVAWQFEQVRTVLRTLTPWARVYLNRPVHVFAARDEATLKTLAPSFWEAKADVRPASVFVTGRDRHYVALRTDTPEPDSVEANPYFQTYWSYVYLVLRASFGDDIPLWFGRGFSDFLANTIVRSKDVQIGRLVPWHFRELRQWRLLPLQQILAGDRQATSDIDSRRYDASAWALVHYLMLGERGANLPKFNAFCQALVAGKDATQALRETYGDLSALEMTVRGYADNTMFVYQQAAIDLNIKAEGFSTRALTAPENAAARAAILCAMQRPVPARGLVQEAMKANSSLAAAYEADALVCELEKKPDDELAALSRAVELGAGSYYSYYRHAQVLGRAGTTDQATLRRMEQSLQRATDLNIWFAAGFSFLADVKVSLNQAPDAEAPARRAVALEPRASYHRVALARALSRTDKKDEALREALAGLALAKDDGERQRAQSLVDYLKRNPGI